MKKIIMIVAMAACAFSFSEANAQKVIKDASGNVFIDVQNMPSKSFSITTLNSVHDEMSATNTVFKKIQIATNIDANKQNHTSAKATCLAYSTEGNQGEWRLPTRSELYLMWILSDALQLSGITLSSEGYWASTSSSAVAVNHWWVYYGSTGDSGTASPAISTLLTRCVREVTN